MKYELNRIGYDSNKIFRYKLHTSMYCVQSWVIHTIEIAIPAKTRGFLPSNLI